MLAYGIYDIHNLIVTVYSGIADILCLLWSFIALSDLITLGVLEEQQ
jgi:hypothetical protein